MPEDGRKHGVQPRENWYRDLWLMIVTGFVVLALISVKEAQDKVDQASRVKSAIICQNITRSDKQTLTNLHTKVDQELIKNLHLTQKQVNKSVRKQLELSAEERRALRPSAPTGSCFPGITTLQTNITTGERTPKSVLKKAASEKQSEQKIFGSVSTRPIQRLQHPVTKKA